MCVFSRQVDYSEMQSVYQNCNQRTTFRMEHRGINLMFEDPVSVLSQPRNYRFELFLTTNHCVRFADE